MLRFEQLALLPMRDVLPQLRNQRPIFEQVEYDLGGGIVDLELFGSLQYDDRYFKENSCWWVDTFFMLHG